MVGIFFYRYQGIFSSLSRQFPGSGLWSQEYLRYWNLGKGKAKSLWKCVKVLQIFWKCEKIMFFRTTEQAPPVALVCLIFFLVCLIKDVKSKRDILFKHNLCQVEMTNEQFPTNIYRWYKWTQNESYRFTGTKAVLHIALEDHLGGHRYHIINRKNDNYQGLPHKIPWIGRLHKLIATPFRQE